VNIHKNARLTPLGRERLIVLIESGIAFAQGARVCGVCAKTASKWYRRFKAEGLVDLHDRSSRPSALRSPTPAATTCARIIDLGCQRLAADYIAIKAVIAGLLISVVHAKPPLRPVARLWPPATLIGGCARGHDLSSALLPDVLWIVQPLARISRCLRRTGLRHIRTKPYTPRTNGKTEHCIQTALRECIYAGAYKTSDQRAADVLSNAPSAVARVSVLLMRCPARPRPFSGIPSFDQTHGLDASASFFSAAGTLFPIAPWGRSSL
jgi:hypothetical protein